MKDVEAGFAEVEKRVKKLHADNAALRKRVAELEDELAQARLESDEIENYRGKRLHVREKIEKVLRSLEALGE